MSHSHSPKICEYVGFAPLTLFRPFRGIELARAVVGDRIVLGELVALPLAGDHVKELRALQLLDVLQRRDQRIEVVAVDRTDVVEAELLEQRRGRHHALHVLLGAPRELPHPRHALEQVLARAAGGRIDAAREQAREIVGERAHRRRDRHLVVVEDHEEIDIHRAGVVHGLVGHARRHRAVADHGDAAALLVLQLGRDRHAEGGGNRSRRVRGAEGVVLRFGAARKPRDAVEHAQPRHRLAPPGEDLVRVGLVADVPDDAVFRGLEDVVQRDGELHRAEVRREVAARFRHRLQHVGAQLVGELAQLPSVQSTQLRRIVDRLQQLVHRRIVGIVGQPAGDRIHG
jgi:hypothetical protein